LCPFSIRKGVSFAFRKVRFPGPVRAMSRYDFLEAELGEAPAASGSEVGRKPPAQWSAAKTSSRFDESRAMGDRSQGGGGGGGGGGGPSLPFRIREVKLVPRSIGSDPVFSIAKPRMLDSK
ncbi:unnamed protein product, partial [Polarella glacialis]